MKRWLLAIMSLVSMLSGVPAVAAQTDYGPLLDLPRPEECIVTPRSIDHLRALLATGDSDAEAARAELEAVADDLLDGEPTPPKTIAELTPLVRESLACIHAGDMLRSVALLTDGHLTRILVASELTAETVADAIPPVESRLDTDWEDLLGIHHTHPLPDGRVVAVVATSGDSVADGSGYVDGELTVMTFARSERWLIGSQAEVADSDSAKLGTTYTEVADNVTSDGELRHYPSLVSFSYGIEWDETWQGTSLSDVIEGAQPALPGLVADIELSNGVSTLTLSSFVRTLGGDLAAACARGDPVDVDTVAWISARKAPPSTTPGAWRRGLRAASLAAVRRSIAFGRSSTSSSTPCRRALPSRPRPFPLGSGTSAG